MFSLKDFVMKTLNGMKGKYPEFQVREYALGWYSKGVLTEEDLVEVDGWYSFAEEDAPSVVVEEQEGTDE